MIVLSGSDPEELGKLAARAIAYYERQIRKIAKIEEITGLYVYHDEFDDANYMKEVFEETIKEKTKITKIKFAVYEVSEKYLGSTFDLLIMDLTKDLKPNDLGRLIGIVRGGGIVILLAPKWDEWDTFMTIFKRNLIVPQYPQPRHIFITWFKRKLLEHNGIAIYDADNKKVIKNFEIIGNEGEKKERKIVYPEKTIFPKEIYSLALTQDQVNVIKLFEHLYEKPKKGKKKAILITADRGRGKSCAVGIGVVGLIHLLSRVKPKVRVLVTAPSPSNVQSLMMLAKKALKELGYGFDEYKKSGNTIELRGEKFSIEYWEPINIPKLRGDIVVVDEAAGIYVTMLYKIWEKHNRLVFSTTIHGYEGAGRGFSVRFLKRIKETPEAIIYEYEMNEPIRYNINDPIERWQFDTLLLDAEPAELDEKDIEYIKNQEFIYVKYDPEYLFSKKGENELRQLFGIYVLAHYRNEPDDLGMIADAPHHIVRAVKLPSGKIVCALQIANEGPIDDDTAIELLRGGKIPGNIIPDRFLKHLRIIDFASTKGWRIVRIATHPEVQGRGIGTWALMKVIEEARESNLDWVGAGFGVNEQLLKFWLKSGFYPVHISPDRNPVSGEYTILVVHPVSKNIKEIIRVANKEFKMKILDSLPVNYRDLEIEVARLFLDYGPPILKEFQINAFTPIQVDRLWTYCTGPMTFEAAADLMYRLAKIYWMLPRDKRPKLTRVQEQILIAKALQGRTWEEIASILKTKQKTILTEARNLACIFLKTLFGIDEEKIPGVRLESYKQQLFLI